MYNPTNKPVNYHDDNRVLRYLLHNVKGISPVSGGVWGEALVSEYDPASTGVLTADNFDFDIGT